MSTSTSGSADHDLSIEPKRAEASLGELLAELTSDLSTLFRKELELAKTEARDEITRAGKGAAMLGGAGLAAWLALIMLSLAAAWLLDQALNTALSFAIVAVVWVIVSVVLLVSGRRRMASIETLPQTRETIKEDVEWAKAQTS
jgi:uncharacterized membrane protein YqjE